MIRDLADYPKSAYPALRLAAAALLGVLGSESALSKAGFTRPRMFLRAGRYREAVAAIYGVSAETITLRERRATVTFFREDVEVEAYLLPDDRSLTISMGVVAVIPFDEVCMARWLTEGLINYSVHAGVLRPSRSVAQLLGDECQLNFPAQIEFQHVSGGAVPS